MRYAFDPGSAVLVLAGALLYARAVRVLSARGVPVPGLQRASWWLGMALLAVALLSPLDAYADDLVSAHMAQHLLLGDLAAPFLLAGLRSPVLQFLLPRPALVGLARRRGLRRVFRRLRRPLVALPVYVGVVYLWHLGLLFEAALRDPWVHAVQHGCFLGANLLLWWPVLEPQRRRMPGDLWKIGYIFGARMATMFLGMGFVFARGLLYAGYYGHGPRLGISPHADQQTAGGMMMTLDIVIMFGALCWFFWRASRDEPGQAATPAPRPGAEAPEAPRLARPGPATPP